MHVTADGLRLATYVARPPGSGRVPAVVLCHGFPTGARGAATSARTYPELADRIAREAGWLAAALNFRGTGESEGDFSIDGWRADLSAAVDALAARDDVRGIWTVGVAEGGTIAVCQAAGDDRVHGVATLAAPRSLAEWTRDPGRLLAHARRIGMIRDPSFPSDRPAWERQLASLDAVAAARVLAPRPLLVIHGIDDDVVDVSDARALADAAGDHAELRVVHAAGHRLRHDPRAVAMLLGWLERHAP